MTRYALFAATALLGCALALLGPEETGEAPEVVEPEVAELPTEEEVEVVEEEAVDGFDIEVVFLEEARLDDEKKAAILKAAEKWESIITDDVPPYNFGLDPFDSDDVTNWYLKWNRARGERVVVVDEVDDLRVVVTTNHHEDGLARAWPERIRDGYFIPALGFMHLSEDLRSDDLYEIALHEFAHTLGFNRLVWDLLGLWRVGDNPGFTGRKAGDSFVEAGGEGYIVPIETDSPHWRESALDDELMTSVMDRDNVLSAVTLGAMADIGYAVDMSHAEPFTLSRGKATGPIAICLSP